MQGKKRASHGPRNPAFADRANGIEPKRLPQVWVKDWMHERLRIAVAQRAEKTPKFSQADWLREAVEEKMDRELGPAAAKLKRSG